MIILFLIIQNIFLLPRSIPVHNNSPALSQLYSYTFRSKKQQVIVSHETKGAIWSVLNGQKVYHKIGLCEDIKREV